MIYPNTPSPLALYLHWPFCLAKCPYCDFNSHVSQSIDFDSFETALCREMTHMASLLPHKQPLSSIFFGGGTPSLMPPKLVARLIKHSETLFGFASNIEITAEANPTSIEADTMLEFHHAGVNRVSMGVQSLDDQSLKFLGREHSVAEALRALDTVRTTFDRVSIDLIYALPDQTPAAWQAMLGRALGLGLGHLSLYQLTIEEGTVFYTKQRRGAVMALDDDRAADLYEITAEMTQKAGLPAYEISNHAIPGQECRHNMIYWQGGDWVGVGPGAHGRFTSLNKAAPNDPDVNNETLQARTTTLVRRSPSGWLDAVAEKGHGIDKIYHDDAHDRATEMVMMGLRLTCGIDLGFIETLCGPRENWLDNDGLARAIEAEWLVLDTTSQHLAATNEGRLRLNHILSIILL